MRQPKLIGKLQRAAGVVTWAAVTGFWLYLHRGSAATLSVALPLALLNLAAMWIAMGDCPGRSVRQNAALWVQLLCALAMGWLLPLSFMPIYTIIWIAMAASYYSLAVCWWLLAGVIAAWFGIMTVGWHYDDAIVTVILYGTFHLFALLSARNAQEAEDARQQVEALNRELLATQHLLSEASRQSERTRIARDLHDLLGHHLTALSLNLQIAEHLTSGEAQRKVEQSRALARLLLSDVREAVSTLRQESAVDFTQAIRLLVDNVPQLDVELDIEDGLAIDDVEIAETLLRCVQEAITNTLRHSGAGRSWIRVWRKADHVHLEVRDDGVLEGELDEGHGFAGMRERLGQLRGSLKLDRVQQALRLQVDIPLAS